MLMGAALAPITTSGDAAAAGPPSTVRNLAAVGGPKTGDMTVSWTAPVTGPVSQYFVQTAADGGAFGAPVSTGTAKKRAMPCAGVSTCTFRVYATNGNGTGPSTDVTSGWASPTVATLKTATGGPDVGQMALKWAAPKSDGGKDVTSYLYDVQTDSAGPWNGPFPMNGAGVTGGSVSCPSTNPAGGCKFRIYPVNSVGVGPVSNAVAGAWKVPKASKVTAVTPGRPVASATIEWSAPTDSGGLTVHYRYQISSDGGPFVNGASTLPDSPRQATVECPATNNCSYKVIAYNGKGAAPTSAAKTSAFNPPGAIRSPRAYVASTEDLNLGSGTPTVTVSWDVPTATGGQPITSYQGRECDGNCPTSTATWNSAPVVPLGTGGSWLTTCPAGLLTCSYQVRAVNVVGPGGWGPAIRITPFAVVSVTAVTAPPVGTVAIGWTGPAEAGQGIDHLSLYKCLVTSGCGNTAHWTDTGQTIPAGSHGTTDFCGADVQCAYRVVAYEVTTGGGSAASASASASGSTLAGAPQNLTAASGTSIGAVDLAWQAPANSGTFPVIDYKFSRSVNGGSYSADISTGSNALTYTDTGCGAGNLCTYKVDAVTLAGTGPYSNTATAEGANVPSAPRTLHATSGTTLGAVDLTWQAPLDDGGWGVTGYYLERSFNSGGTWTQSWTLGTSPSYTDTACGEGVACTYRVSAINARGTGPVSNSDTATGTNLSPPQSLTATTSTSTLGGVLLSWGYPLDDGGYPIQGYEFRYQVNAGAFSAWVSTGTGTGTSFTHLCGQDNTCNYEVRAFNVIGTSSPSNDASAMGLTDHTAPTVTVTTPTNGSNFTTTATPGITGTAGAGLGDATTVNVTIKLSGGAVRSFAVTRSGTSWTVGAGEWSATSPLPDGTYTVVATQSDWASNTGTSNENTFTVHNAPTVSITSPANAAVYSSSGTTYAGETSWASGCSANTICGTAASSPAATLTSVTVTIRQGTGNYWNGSSFGSGTPVSLTATGTTSWSLAFPIANFPAGGAYTVTATATDSIGNVSVPASNTFDVDYNPTAVIFVNPAAANDSGNGQTPATADKTINGGLADASVSRPTIVVAVGAHTGTVSTVPATAVTVRGGYSAASWLRAAHPRSRTAQNTSLASVITGTTGTDATGFLVNGYTATLQQLTVNSGTASGVGANAYGVRSISSGTVTLQRSVVAASAAVGGTAGSDASGNDGNGNTGGDGQGPAGNGNSNRGAGGGGGGASGRNGGGGGTGGAQGNNSGGSGSQGFVQASGQGGTGGNGGGGSSDTFCDTDAGAGGGGNPGAAGTANAAGSAGSLLLANGAATFGGTSPTGGSAGNAGHGGGGGGGGGGEHNSFCTDDHGAGGGGGGGAGGGGNAGGAGSNGGSSFGVYAFNATVSIDANSSVTAGNAGSGGRGGNGSAGGSGAQGGVGGQCDGGQEGGGGGSGGSGGGGAGGSGGGGGAGGHSMAVYHRGTGTMTNAGSLTKGAAGSAGVGGSGGSGGGGASGRGSSGKTNGSGCNAGGAGGGSSTGSSGTGGGGGSTGTAVLTYDNGSTTG